MVPLDPENPEYYLGASIALHETNHNENALKYLQQGQKKLKNYVSGDPKAPVNSYVSINWRSQKKYWNRIENPLISSRSHTVYIMTALLKWPEKRAIII